MSLSLPLSLTCRGNAWTLKHQQNEAATTFDVREEIEDAFESYRALLEKQGIQ